MNVKLKLLFLFAFILLLPLTSAITTPSGITSYASVNLTNSQTTSTPAPFQQMANITESSFSSIVYNPNFANFEYFYSNGTIIPAWIESNNTGVLTTWLNLVKGINASSSLIVYLGFANSTTNLLSNTGTTGIGEAPQLSTTYAEYDDGAVIFPYYQAWGGLSALPSGWVSLAGTVITYTANYTLVYSGSTASTWYGISLNTSIVSNKSVFDLYGNMYNNGNGYQFMGINSGSAGTNRDGYGFGSGLNTTPIIYLENNGTVASISTGIDDTNNTKIYTMLIDITNINMLLNYTSIFTTTSAVSEIPIYLNIQTSNGGSPPASGEYIYWLRTRAYPPNGVMPSVVFGAVVVVENVVISISPSTITYGSSAVINASCVPSGDTCNIDNPLGTHIASGTGSATYTISAGSLAVGTYKYYVNDTTDGLIGNASITINQAQVDLSLNDCGNSVYSAFACKTTGTFNTNNNTIALKQITANLYVNNLLVNSTTNTLNKTLISIKLDQINFYNIVFNYTGNTNYTANTINVKWSTYVPLEMVNTGGITTFGLTATTLNTYYPLKIYTQSPNTTINYTLIQNNVDISVNALNISYVLPITSTTGTYTYKLVEKQGAIQLQLNTSVVLNRTTISAPITYSTAIQYFSILADTPTWTSKPSNWYIFSAPPNKLLETNNTIGSVFTWNTATTISPVIYVNYGAPFNVNFNLSYTINPTLTSITLAPFIYTLSNTIDTNKRLIANISIFDQETFNSIVANVSMKIPTNFNGYLFNGTITNNTGSKYYLEILKSNYLNPNITFQLNGTISRPYFYAPSQKYCPTTIANGDAANYNIGLVDTNGTKYSFYIYTTAGSSANNYLLYINELKGTGAISSASYQIPSSLPMAVPLETTGQEYQYIIYSPNCHSTYYHGSFTDPTNPTYLTLTAGNNQAIIYNTTNVNGKCTLNTTTNPYNLVCVADDTSSQVYKYVLKIYNETNVLGSTELIKQQTFLTPNFVYNTTLPINRTYTYSLFAYAFKSNDPVFLVAGGLLTFNKIAISAPLLGVFAFLLMLTLIMVGVQTGKPLIIMLLVDIGMFAVSILNLVQIPTSVVVIFIILGILFSFWSIKLR